MYRIIFLSLAIGSIIFVACDRKPFVEHKLKFEKVSDGCNINPQSFKMTSNFGGERYEFDRCLPTGFSKEQMTTSRRGDTVVVSFQKPTASESKAIFNVTLDIDSYPKYHFLTIDNDTYAIVAAN
ncbi:MAG: hypothetical protein H7Y42_02595 [Chitinophagaceae bacterium]|nr:hypothetical protein [Chitinophagaceae bacterium]